MDNLLPGTSGDQYECLCISGTYTKCRMERFLHNKQVIISDQFAVFFGYSNVPLRWKGVGDEKMGCYYS